MTTGIYSIQVNDYFYYGSAKSIEKRWKWHISDLKRGVHKNNIMQALYNKYSINSFEFKIVEICDIHELISKEQYYIDILFNSTVFKPINLQRLATSHLGMKRSIESRLKMKKPKSDAHKEKLRALGKQQIPSQAEKDNIERLKKTYIFISPAGDVVTITGLREFCDKYSLDKSSMHNLYYNKKYVKSHKGWKRYTGDDS